MPSQPKSVEVSALTNPAVRVEAYRLWRAFLDTPSDVLQTRDGHYLSFDAYCQLVLAHRLRPRLAHLAARELTYTLSRRP